MARKKQEGKQLTPDQDKQLYGLLAQGMTFGEIAVQFNCSMGSLYEAFDRLHIMFIYNVTITGQLPLGRGKSEPFEDTRSFLAGSREEAQASAKHHWRAIKNARFKIAYGGVAPK